MRTGTSRPGFALAFVTSLVFGLITSLSPHEARADDANEIDLKLFGENVIQGWEGCRLGFWQANRNPDEDSYAYVFFAPIPDGEALPGWVKIGEDVLEVSKRDIGSADTGMLEPFQLYKSSDGKLTLLVEIYDQTRSGRGIEINDGRVTFLRNDKFPFPVRVKGLNGCLDSFDDSAAVDDAAEAPSGQASGLSLGQPVDFDSLDRIPPPIMRAIASDAPDCEPENTPGFSSAYSVNDDITLWQIPCVLYARNASSVFALSWTYHPDHASVLLFPSQPGSGEADHAEVLNAVVDPATATVTSDDGGFDCGIRELFQLRDAEGETLEFTLLEVREKTDCDGIETDPRDYPLVFDNR
ncbi:hypothetical protein HPDFL43_09522 [Hoeflea phototrophica DFL-43]|uniref:DUF1176 domain-containing protein n=1 Tax=Hoeflea phototrophica (strain DSM 17068 / NCIMB 14078 / DFL-43) TaxID=411684 RepID=A9D6C6_HOEPD|nr:hypothetical protein [Hoeflea phototrophica]EDQ33465.2 hypothetical protein HPDFL43_09522 [Hoeflea phototrophica DFL-43]